MSLRIRSVARLSGVNEATLRAWERRYGFPEPARNESNNYRSYSADDVAAIQRVQALIAQGYRVSEAIELVRGPRVQPLDAVRTLEDRFWSAAQGYDSHAMTEVLEDARRVFLPREQAERFLLPLLRAMSDRLDVAQEHFASAMVRGRLRALLTVGTAQVSGPTAVLACAPGDEHEGGLLGLAVHLRSLGWGTVVLGANTPVHALADACLRAKADVAAVSLVNPLPVTQLSALLMQLGLQVAAPVVVGGPAVANHAHLAAAAGVALAHDAQGVVAFAEAQAGRRAAEA